MATTKRGGWIITPAGGAGADPRVLDTDETGGAVAETIAALTAASLLQKTTPAAARDAADEVRYPHGGAPQSAVRKAVQVKPPEDEAAVDVSAAEMPAEERVAALHPPPPADTPEARPANRVPPVSAYTRSRHMLLRWT